MHHRELKKATDQQLFTEAKARGWKVEIKVIAEVISADNEYEEFVKKLRDDYGVIVKLPKYPSRILHKLVANFDKEVKYESLLHAMYFDDPAGGPLTAKNCLSLGIMKVRRQLRGSPYYIENYHGESFKLMYLPNQAPQE